MESNRQLSLCATRERCASDPSLLSAKSFGSVWAARQFEADHGIGLSSLGDIAAFDFWHEGSGARVELKASRLSARGAFSFQYICPERFDVAVFLGYCPSQPCRYWVIPVADLLGLLSRQHRDGASHQLRISLPRSTQLSGFEAGPDELRDQLSRVCTKAVKKRRRVRLDSAFEMVEGWSNVATFIERSLKRDFNPRWQIRIVPMQPSVEGMIPYPAFCPNEFRMDVLWPLKPVIGRTDIRATAGSIVDFLYQYDWPAGDDPI